jgi:hypothetical protein
MPASSTSNSPSPLFASELSELLRDDPMVNLINQTYNDDAVSAAFMRHYSFITMNIRRMRELLDEQLRERQEVFEHMMKDADLQEKLQPIVTSYRQRCHDSRPVPYTKKPMFQQRLQTPFRPTNPSSSSSLPSEPTNDNQPGSLRNPIVIEVSEAEEVMVKPYERSESMRPRFRPTCEQCGQIGHNKDDCQTSPRLFLRCDYCHWLKQSQRLCTHYMKMKRGLWQLRRKMGLPLDVSD